MPETETTEDAVNRIISVVEGMFILSVDRGQDVAAAAATAFILFDTAVNHPEWAQVWQQLLRKSGAPQAGTRFVNACPVSVTSEEDPDARR